MKLKLSEPYWYRRSSRRPQNVHGHYCCDLIGVPSTYPSENWARIDFSLGPTVLWLYEHGFRSEFSCSGVPTEHEGWMPLSGYIMFQGPKLPVVRLDDVYVDGPSIRMRKPTPKKWAAFLAALQTNFVDTNAAAPEVSASP